MCTEKERKNPQKNKKWGLHFQIEFTYALEALNPKAYIPSWVVKQILAS